MKEPTDLMMEWGFERYSRAFDELIEHISTGIIVGGAELSNDAKELRDALDGVDDGTNSPL
jgi:hypothetical protein